MSVETSIKNNEIADIELSTIIDRIVKKGWKAKLKEKTIFEIVMTSRFGYYWIIFLLLSFMTYYSYLKINQ